MGQRLRKFFVLSVLLCFVLWPHPARAEGPHRAGLIVVYAPDDVYSVCVTFNEPELTGVDLLRRAGLRVIGAASPGMGEAICKIGAVGCDFPGEECFCQCSGTPCAYWSYWYWEKGTWVYSGKGAGNRKVHDGDIDAWVWGDGKAKPPMPRFEGSCASLGVPAPTATKRPLTPTPRITPTPQVAATGTPLPTATQAAQRTNTPLEFCSATATCSPTRPPTLTPLPTSTPEATLTVSPEASSGSPSLSPTSISGVQPSGRNELETSQQRSAGSQYGAFVGLALFLLLLIGCAVYLRKRQSLH
jgi:hypothetical protein